MSETSEVEGQAIDFKSLFEKRICDLPTHIYLRDETLVGALTPLISARFESDTETIKSSLEAGPGPCTRDPRLRVALTNVHLQNYAGSELWVADTAKYLKSAGVDTLVYSTALGPVAEMIRRAGVEVTSSIDDVASFKPTILHINHFEAAAPVVDRLKGGPAVINMVHGLLPRPGLPGYANVEHYCCVSIHAKAKIHVLTRTPWTDIESLPNFFDERRFTGISTSAGGGKALLFSSRTLPDQKERLEAQLAPLGFELDHIGYGGRPTCEPEQALPAYDIVFAVGRSAIESLASGAHVILWDFGIVGPAVTKENFWQCVASNFDLASNMLPWRFIESPDITTWVREQVQEISDVGRSETTRLVRAYLPLSAAGNRLLSMYQKQFELHA